MPKLFLSYRRDDSDFPTHQIYQVLAARFGRDSVFYDQDSIPVGVDFRKYLSDSVACCDMLIAVIGPHWLDARDEYGERRLDDERDFVRIEIEAALQRNTPIVPVLVGRVSMPRVEDLPTGLMELSYRNSVNIRSGRDFDNDVSRMVVGIEKLLQTKPTAAPIAVQKDLTSPLHTTPIESSQNASTRTKTSQIPDDTQIQTVDVLANTIGAKLAFVPAGQFLMGSPYSDSWAADDERPQHQVEITNPFRLGVYPVTQEEYEEVVGKESRSAETGSSGRLKVGKQPVSISWFDAVKFCNVLSEREGSPPYYRIDGTTTSIINGIGYRLPTEAEWEYACRAGTTTTWSFGDSPQGGEEYGWYMKHSRTKVHPVGTKKANPWGLHDTHGNVWEWCWDWYDDYGSGPYVDPLGPNTGRYRVLRGGGWGNNAANVRSALRLGKSPDRTTGLGFRLAKNVI